MCDLCVQNYGSCPLFKSYEIKVKHLNVINLRDTEEPQSEIVGQEKVDSEFILPGSVVAVAAPKKSNIVWFIQVIEINRVCTTTVTDNYNHEIPRGMVHLTGNFLERDDKHSTSKATAYTLLKQVTFFYKENILYPYVNIQEKNNRLSLSVSDYTDILYYIEKNGFSHL